MIKHYTLFYRNIAWRQAATFLNYLSMASPRYQIIHIEWIKNNLYPPTLYIDIKATAAEIDTLLKLNYNLEILEVN